MSKRQDYRVMCNGMSARLDLDGRGLASGVSYTTGEIPRFSDAVRWAHLPCRTYNCLLLLDRIE